MDVENAQTININNDRLNGIPIEME